MVLGVEFEQHFEQRRRHLEVVDQKVVDGRGADQLQGRPRVAVRPFEIDLLVLGDEFGKALEGLETFVAGPLDISGLLHLPRTPQHLGEIVGALANDLEGLVGRGVKRGFAHHRVAV